MSTPSPPVPGPPPTTPGTILAGKYRVERIIGQGGMGVVVEARHIALEERVALKFLQPDYATHKEAAERFLREARAAVKIKSTHVARVSDVGTLENGAPYMVMEYLEGCDAGQLLERQGVLPLQDAVDFTIQACEAIAEAHTYNIVHRDLKPANMFVTRHNDGSPLVKVLDFGISKVMGGGGIDNLTKTTAAMGSALYMSPEQMQSTRSVDHRTDIYALGVSLYELLAGKQPYYADTLPQLCAEILTGTPTPLRSLRPDLPDPFASVVEKAYARDRAQRFQSVAEFVIGLAPWAPARSQPVIDRIARMGGMSPPVAGAAAGPGGTQVLGRAASDPLIVPGHYTGPSSAKAAAAFATSNPAGGVTDLSATGSGGAVRPPQKGMGIVIGAGALSAIAVAAIIAVVVMKAGGSSTPAAPDDTSPAPTAPPPPTPETATAAAATVAPPPASATADPAPEPEPAAQAKPGGKPAPGGRKPATTATSTAKTTAPVAAPPPQPQPPTPTPTKKPNAFDDR